MNTQQVDRLSTHGAQVLYDLPAYPRIGVTGFVPDGIAVAPGPLPRHLAMERVCGQDRADRDPP
jgi:hypothetical protein